MRLIAQTDNRTVWAIDVESPDSIKCPPVGTPFPCLIWDHDGRLAGPERSAIAGVLIDAGCRYVVCAGQNCEAWHDETDDEDRRRHPNGIEDESFVMTSWHEGQSPKKVAFFFIHCTMQFDRQDVEYPFSKYLVLHVGCGKSVNRLDAAVAKCAAADIDE